MNEDDLPHPPRLTLPPRGPVPPVDGGSSVTVVDLASTGVAVDAWTDGARRAAVPLDLRRLPAPDPVTFWHVRQSLFDDLAGGRFVGWRLAIAGPEYAVLGLQSIALGSGLLPDEVVVHPEPAPWRVVYCPHCSAVTTVDTRAPIVCGGCRLRLLLHDHFNTAAGYFLASVHGER